MGAEILPKGSKRVKLTAGVVLGRTIRWHQSIISRVALRCIWYWRFVVGARWGDELGWEEIGSLGVVWGLGCID